jgi:putative tryptophan/tyrosine transport system substrate-binding protein
MKSVKYVVIIWVMLSLPGLNSNWAWAEKKIGVFTFSQEARYLDAIRGFKDRLVEAGFGDDKVTYFAEDAGANKARAAEAVRKFAEAKPDLILALGTSATLPLCREIKDTPIVFSIVYDPVEAGIAASWKSSANNTTGTSTFLPLSKVMGILKEFTPFKTIGILYTFGEKNSESQVRDLQDIQDSYHFKVVPVLLNRQEDVDRVLPSVLRAVDVLYVTGSNVVNASLPNILDMATKAKVVTVTHLEDLVARGVLLGVCSDSYALGRSAGGKALEIFNGKKPSEIPIDPAADTKVMLNMITAKSGYFSIPAKFMSSVTKRIE